MKKLYESSPLEEQRQVRQNDIILTDEMTEELKQLNGRKILLADDASEIKAWDETVIGKFYRPLKKQITLRLDADVLEWFKNSTDKYQTLINQACREYMKSHR
jgi:uncharacterized protein (DUF4415 family)